MGQVDQHMGVYKRIQETYIITKGTRNYVRLLTGRTICLVWISTSGKTFTYKELLRRLDILNCDVYQVTQTLTLDTVQHLISYNYLTR